MMQTLHFETLSRLIMNKHSVTKHNGLIQAGYRLSLNEARIVLYGISLINPLAEDFPLEYQIDIKSRE